MVLKEDENVCSGSIKLDDRCLVEDCPDIEGKKSVDIDEGCEDIADMLPKDPFGMENNIELPNDPFEMNLGIEATFAAAINGLLEDFGLKTCRGETDEASTKDENVDDDNECYAELEIVWTSSSNYEEEVGGKENLMCFGSELYQSEDSKVHNDGAPADALFFALGYLSSRDLLSAEMVCKSFRDAVRNDNLLWRNIQIDYPLSVKITDYHLLRLTNRAEGKLHTLSLPRCFKITNIGLKHVLETNLELTQLSVPGCTKVSAEGILHEMKMFNSICMPGIKRLRVSEVSNLTTQHYEEFKLLLGVDVDKTPSNNKSRFLGPGQEYLTLDDERVLDIEPCPKCRKPKQVFDCPSETCQVKIHNPDLEECRACIFCIKRCMNCGCCLEDKLYVETFCMEGLCGDCLTQLFDRHDMSPSGTFVHKKTSCHLVFYG